MLAYLNMFGFIILHDVIGLQGNWGWFSAGLVVAFSSALLTWGAYRFISASKEIKVNTFKLGISVLAFSSLDLILLKLLPVLRISFGPVRLPWISLMIVRIGLAMIWVLLIEFPARIKVINTFIKMRKPFYLAQGMMCLIMIYAFYWGPSQLSISFYEEEIPVETDLPIRIIHLTDIHMERLTGRDEKMLEEISNLQPDLIVLTGDYLNTSYLEDPTAMQDAIKIFSSLEAPLGVYAVDGNVDGDSQMLQLFKGLDAITVLEDEVVPVPGIEGMNIVGISLDGYHVNANKMAMLEKKLPENGFEIFLHHKPGLIEWASEKGADLYLAGHTHGGQIRLPFYGAITTFSIFGKEYEMGRYQVGEMTGFISRGIGMEGGQIPRVRFLCPPEIVVVDLVPPIDS